MKFLTLTKHLIFLALAGFAFLLVSADSSLASENSNYRVVKGERPPIQLSSITPDAYEPGVLLIKVHQQFSSQLEANPVSRLADGSFRFQIQSIDQLNDLHNVNDIEQYFRHPALGSQFTERHKAWGFDLWYRLEFPENADLMAILNEYAALEDILVVEPEFKKALIEGINYESLDFQDVLNTASNPSLNWTPNDPSLGNQWHYHNTGQSNGTPGADISLLAAWDIEKGNQNVIVAIVDEGIQFNHPDLAVNMWEGIGYNFVNNSPNVSPGGHGTHVGGTVAAVTNNGVGVAGIAGGSGSGDGVRLMSTQVFMGGSSGGFHLAPVWAADNGAAISQNSWGYTSPNVYNQNVLDAIDYFNINGGGDALLDGGITIFAAGNSNSSAPYYPGYYSGAMAVAGTNNQDQKSWYSNYGSYIDISAPGGETNSVNSRGVLSTVTNSGYAYYQGTSMACPHVSGVAALIISLAYGQLTPDELKDILVNSVDDHYGANPNFIGQLGSGRLNAYEALLLTQSYMAPVMNPGTFQASTFGTSEINLSWSRNPNEDPVMLVWSMNENFGSPDSGMIYQAGTMFPGGGMVLYSGLNQSFLHTNLEPSTYYYYKIWSYDSLNQYSLGRTAFAATACELFIPPFYEGFEDMTELPLCWMHEFVSGNVEWTVGTGNDGNNPPNAYNGNFNMFFKAQEEDQLGYTSRLVLPIVDLAPYQEAEIIFAYTNEMRVQASVQYQDILKVLFKPSINAPWQILALYDSNVANWTEVVVPLPVSSSTSFIAFEAKSGRGHGVCIDHLAIVSFGNVPTYNLASSSGPDGIVIPLGNIAVGQNGNYMFTINADTHYMIDSIFVDNNYISEGSGLSTYNYSFTNITEDRTIHATFTPLSYQVQSLVVPPHAGSVEGTGTYPFNQMVSLFAVENPGFVFNRWAEAGVTVSTNNPFEFNLSSNRNLVAFFSSIVYSISSEVTPAGAGTVSGGGSFLYGAQVNLLAQPKEGFYFVEWLEDDEVISSDNPLSFTVSENKSITARFDISTSINRITDNEFTVYPNPSNGYFTLETNEYITYQIRDLTGRVVMNEASGPGKVVLNLSGKPSGVYFLAINGSDGSRVIKLMVQ